MIRVRFGELENIPDHVSQSNIQIMPHFTRIILGMVSLTEHLAVDTTFIHGLRIPACS